MLKGVKDEIGLLEDIGEDTVTDKKSHKHLHVVGEGTVQRDNDPMRRQFRVTDEFILWAYLSFKGRDAFT